MTAECTSQPLLRGVDSWTLEQRIDAMLREVAVKLALLADIHEAVEHLEQAIRVLRDEGVERYVVLGDLAVMGERLDETVGLLRAVDAVGVWGNHEFALCKPDERTDRSRYGTDTQIFLASLRPTLEIDDCFFCHIEPWLDANRVEDLWYMDGSSQTPEELARCFHAQSHRVCFVGHHHQQLLAKPDGHLDWSNGNEHMLTPPERYVVWVGALCDGRFAMYDTDRYLLRAYDLQKR